MAERDSKPRATPFPIEVGEEVRTTTGGSIATVLRKWDSQTTIEGRPGEPLPMIEVQLPDGQTRYVCRLSPFWEPAKKKAKGAKAKLVDDWSDV